MGNLLTQFTSAQTVYALILNASGQIWNTSTLAFETLTAVDYANYPIAMTEQIASHLTGIYEGVFPTGITAAGTYRIFFRQQSGGSPAASDASNALMPPLTFAWNGSAEVFPITTSTGGPVAFTISVTDPSSNPIQNALVSLNGSGQVYSGNTNSSGQVLFSLLGATYTVAIVAPGFTFTPVPLVITTAGSEAYALTTLTAPSGVTPPTCLAYITTLDPTGAIESGVQIQFMFLSDNGAAGVSTDTSIITATSVGTSPNNLSQQLRQNATYQARRGSQLTWTKFTTGNTDVFQLPEVIGSP